mmetsp:Transcript_18054/g.33891  ORF Transcript_18054/g.33891 Transcript_18054/m.33891 type:complete len:122 (-) Transcript_18054:153-518(-)
MSEFTKETQRTYSSDGQSASALQALESLEQIDKDIAHIMKCAHDTVVEMENIPHADFSKLQELSEDYFQTCDKVKAKMKGCVEHIHPYSPSGQGTYALRKKLELAEAQAHITSNSDESSSS